MFNILRGSHAFAKKQKEIIDPALMGKSILVTQR